MARVAFWLFLGLWSIALVQLIQCNPSSYRENAVGRCSSIGEAGKVEDSIDYQEVLRRRQRRQALRDERLAYMSTFCSSSSNLDSLDNEGNNHSGLLWPNSVPKAKDWRDYGQVTDVANQNGCNACWAFAVAGSIEALAKRKTGYLIKLSAQQLLDCSGTGSDCKGGHIVDAMQHARLKGMQMDRTYPYKVKTMDNEIRLYDKQIADYKDELELLNDEYRKIRQEYFDAKSRSQLPPRLLEGGDLDDGRNQNKAGRSHRR